MTTGTQASRRSFAGLMTAEAISLFGSRMTFVALPWLVLVTTGSATRTGVVAFAEMLPYVLASAAGGPLVDRIGPRRTAIAMDVLSVLVVAGIPVLYRTLPHADSSVTNASSGGLSFAALVALVAVAGLVRGLGDTGKRVLFPRAVAEAGIAMTRATSIHDGLSRAATLIGAPLAGLLIAATDAPTVLFVDAASFGAAALLVITLVRPRAATAERATDGAATEAPAGSYLGQLREGVAFVLRDKLVLGIVLMLFLTNLLDQAYATVFVPVWAKEVFGSPVGIGVTAAAFAAGAVIGNIVYAVLATRLPRYATFAIGFLIGGAPRFVTLALGAPLWTIVAVAFTAGIGLAAVNPILGAVSYERIPERLIARVMGLSVALSWAGIPLGSLLAGLGADHLGIRWALLVGAGVYLVATVLPFTTRVWRQMDNEPVAAPEAAEVVTSDPVAR